MKLNLGCGNIRKEGWTNCDFVKTGATDKVFDMMKFPYPFKAGSIDEIELSEVLEHLPETIPVLKECHRVLKSEGTIHITVPYYLSYHAWSNPEHKRAFNFQTFKYFDAANELSKIHNFGFSFKSVRIKFRYGKGKNPLNYIFPAITNKCPDLVEKTFLKFMFCPEGLDVRIVK